MGIFISPNRIAAAIQKGDTYCLIKKDISWYLSPEGGQAYNAANTLGEKVLFFYKFLLSNVPVFHAAAYNVGWSNENDQQENERKEKARLIAWIFADAIAVSRLPYATWPSILDEKRNPLLRWLLQPNRRLNDLTSEALIAVVRSVDSKQLRLNMFSDYQNLTPYSPESEDVYLLERELLFAFPCAFQNNSMKSDDSYVDKDERFLQEQDDLLADIHGRTASERFAVNLRDIRKWTAKAEDTLLGAPSDTIQQLNLIADQFECKNKLEADKHRLKEDLGDYVKQIDRVSKKNIADIENRAKQALLQRRIPNVHPMYHQKLSLNSEKISLRSVLGLFSVPAAILFGLLGQFAFALHWSTGITLLLLLLLGGSIFLIIKEHGGKAMKEHIAFTEEGESWMRQANAINYAENRKRFISECRTMDESFFAVESAFNPAKVKVIDESRRTIEKIQNEYSVVETEATSRINGLLAALNNQTLVHRDYLYLAGDVARILESGRADSFKEALNLAIEEDRRKRAEEAREEEELRRQEALEEQLRLERESREYMERIAREQADEERRWHFAQQEAAERAQKAAEDAARQQRWAAEAEAKRSASHSMHAYYEAKKIYDSESRMYRSSVNVHGANSSDALRHKANMDKALADMINSGFQG